MLAQKVKAFNFRCVLNIIKYRSVFICEVFLFFCISKYLLLYSVTLCSSFFRDTFFFFFAKNSIFFARLFCSLSLLFWQYLLDESWWRFLYWWKKNYKKNYKKKIIYDFAWLFTYFIRWPVYDIYINVFFCIILLSIRKLWRQLCL